MTSKQVTVTSVVAVVTGVCAILVALLGTPMVINQIIQIHHEFDQHISRVHVS